jgi:hypothetical protein
MQLIFCLFWRKIILKNIYDFPYLPNIEKCFRRETFFKKLTSLKLFYERHFFTYIWKRMFKYFQTTIF